jgi:hypothetical protein
MTFAADVFIKGYGYRRITIEARDTSEARGKLEFLYGEGTVTNVHRASVTEKL